MEGRTIHVPFYLVCILAIQVLGRLNGLLHLVNGLLHRDIGGSLIVKHEQGMYLY